MLAIVSDPSTNHKHSIECPFDKDAPDEHQELFRLQIKKLYNEFSKAPVKVEYEHEIGNPLFY